MKITPEEQEAIGTVIRLGGIHGFGNLIAHLQTAWAAQLMLEGFSEATSRLAAGPGLPFQLAADILERGEWDETWVRYRPTDGRS